MATKKAAATGTDQKHSIPNAVRPAAPSGDDLFDSLGEDGATTVKETGKKGDRPDVPIPPAVVEAYKRFIGAAVLREIVGKRAELSEAEVDRAVFDLWVEALFKNGTQPANSSLKLDKEGAPGRKDLEALFQVQDKFTKNNIHLPEPNPGETLQAATVRLLVEMGLPQDKAEAFVTKEVDMKPTKGLKSFNELKFGHYEGEGRKQWVDATPAEQAVADKLMQFVASLPPEERKLVLVTQPKVDVKKGAIGRIPAYCSSLAHVRAIFKVFEPVHFVSKAKLGISDTPAERVERLSEIAKEIIGTSDVVTK